MAAQCGNCRKLDLREGFVPLFVASCVIVVYMELDWGKVEREVMATNQWIRDQQIGLAGPSFPRTGSQLDDFPWGMKKAKSIHVVDFDIEDGVLIGLTEGDDKVVFDECITSVVTFFVRGLLESVVSKDEATEEDIEQYLLLKQLLDLQTEELNVASERMDLIKKKVVDL